MAYRSAYNIDSVSWGFEASFFDLYDILQKVQISRILWLHENEVPKGTLTTTNDEEEKINL